jgi:FixJ family two-component response regulator
MANPGAGRIIVVDDDRSVCRALGRLLRSFGFEVQTFGSAAEVLAAGPPEDTLCLVADVRMPGMGGMELREKLHGSGHDVPTVLITAHGIDELRARVPRGTPVLEKPIGADQLLAAIDVARRDAVRRRAVGAGRGIPRR